MQISLSRHVDSHGYMINIIFFVYIYISQYLLFFLKVYIYQKNRALYRSAHVIQFCEIFQTLNDMQMLFKSCVSPFIQKFGSKIVWIIFCYGERVRMYEFVMKRLKVTEM